MQLDYASILQGGKSLVPDFRQQTMQDEAFAMQRDAMQMQRDEMAQRQAKARQAEERQAAFMRDFEDVMRGGGRPDQITTLMMRYPDLMEGMKPALERMDTQQKERDVGALGAVYTRLSKGDRAGAAAAMRERVQADVEAGLADPADERILAALEGDNEADLGVAMAHIGAELFALAGKDRFEAVYGKSEEATQIQREVEYYKSIGRDDLAQLALQNKADPVVVGQPGAPIYRSSQFAGTGVTAPQPKGGDQSTGAQAPPTGSAIEQAALSAVPGLTVTSRRRSAAKNASVGGVPNSYHLTDQARDFVPPRGMSMGQLAGRLRQSMPGYKVINEGDHVHVEPVGRNQGPARVRSKQQYDRLPSGTQYVAPDGSMRVKP